MNLTPRAANQLQALEPADVTSIIDHLHDRPYGPGAALVEIETTCPRCRQPFTPTPEAIRAGTWRVCPACTSDPLKQGASAVTGLQRPGGAT